MGDRYVAGAAALVALASVAMAQDGLVPSLPVTTLPDGTRAIVQPLTPAQASESSTPPPFPADRDPGTPYVIRSERWSEGDEKDYGQFVAELGASGCSTVDACLHNARNPFRASDPQGTVFASDCADFPYYLRFYFAWKRGLPFSYESEVSSRGGARDLRYSVRGNEVAGRVEPAKEDKGGYVILYELRDAVSSATYRIDPELEEPYEQDFYSSAIDRRSIRPGTVIYDPNGHLAIVWKVDRDGRIRYLDAHPDFTVTRGFYDLRFVRSSPGMGAGFKNWRPQTLVGATRGPDGTYTGGHIVLAANKDIPQFSLAQYFGNGVRPAKDVDWNEGRFTLKEQTLDYYDFVRAAMAGGRLSYDPLREVADMEDSNCADLQYRVQAVDLAIQAGLANEPEPNRLPPNIYGTEGDWETYSTPSRDARLKTAFKELRDAVARFLWMGDRHDKRLAYRGTSLASDMLTVYDRHAARCRVTYTRTDGSRITLGYEALRRRLFDLSFDPYQCVERRWGAASPAELTTCRDGPVKAAWYAAEGPLRNQLDRAYEARTDFTLAELQEPGPGKGVRVPPDTDVRKLLLARLPKPAPGTLPAKAPPLRWMMGRPPLR